MHINHQYFVDLALELKKNNSRLRLLDYGCGKGQLAESARNLGIDSHGADVFYGANPESREELKVKGALGEFIHEIIDQRTPFEANSFDIVVSNMVFEHVQDLEPVAMEIYRVLKPGGYLIAAFPTLECWREGHIGIPFAHWFGRNSGVRYPYVLGLRALGFGFYKTSPPKEWTREMLTYIDNYTHYRTRREIQAIISRDFEVHWIESHYVSFRLGRSYAKPLVPMLSFGPARWLGVRLFRRLGFSVLIGNKKDDKSSTKDPPWATWSTKA